MPTLPADYLKLIRAFVPHFSKAIWQHAQVLLLGTILTTSQRTVTSALRVVGLSAERHFQTYHRVLNRATWSSLALSRVLLDLLLTTFAPLGPVLVGMDDTIERRRGAQIKAKGIYRDPIRSSHSHFVKASGLRWLSLMLLVPIPWAERVWALPFLTVLAPSERYYSHRQRGHKKLTDWARQLLVQLRRWLPQRRLVVVADSSFAVLALLARLRQLPQPISMIVRFRLDAALYEPAPPRQPHQKGRPRLKGQRLPTLTQVAAHPLTRWQRVTLPDWYGEGRRTIEIVSSTAVWCHSGQPVVPIRWVLIRDPKGKFKTQALLSTDLNIKTLQILQWFIMRWQLEVTFREVRQHLGVETQRQWNDKAILRTTPALLALFSVITLLAHHHVQQRRLPVRRAAWYVKPRPTFSDAVAVVRQHLWLHLCFTPSDIWHDRAKLADIVRNRLIPALSYTP